MQHEKPTPIDLESTATQRRAMLVGLGGIAAGALLSGKVQAGPLDPPTGPVASTGKTLAEIEPRTAINAVNTPGSATAVFRITQPGSYYLTGNIAGVSGKHGIEIVASNVSLDLMGFSLRGAAGSQDGVKVNTAVANITVRNGSASGWGGDGFDLGPIGLATGVLVECVHASGNAVRGIVAGDNAIIRDCSATQNGNSGISVSRNGVVHRCVSLNNATFGIICGNASSMTNCVAQDNGSDGFFAGIGCTANGCSSLSNSSSGFVVGTGSVIANCVANENTQVGIIASAGTLVRSNACRSNRIGIQTSGSDSRVELNNCVFNDSGFRVTSSGNFIVSNTSSGSLTNWDIVAGNVCIVVQANAAAAIVGNSGGVSPGSSNPNANFTF